MTYKYRGGGIDALLGGITVPAGKNRDYVRAKSLDAENRYLEKIIGRDFAENDIPTLGLENFFRIEQPELNDEYYRLVGSFHIGSYPVYSDSKEKLAQSDSRANMYFWWRSYTVVRVAQLLNARNYETSKHRASARLLAGICNCTVGSIDTVAGEFRRSGKKHARLFIRVPSESAEKDIRGAALYCLTEEPPELYIAGVRAKLSQFSHVLDKYDEFLKEKINRVTHSGFVKFKLNHDVRSGGKRFWIHKAHIHGRDDMAAVRSLYIDDFVNARQKL